MPRTYTYPYTYTYTYTRLEAIEDQFDHFLRFGGIENDVITRVRQAVRDQKIAALGMYACNADGQRILEVVLAVDWAMHAKLTLNAPEISREHSGWEGTMTAEIKLAGRRFSEAIRELGTRPLTWVRWVRAVFDDRAALRLARLTYGLGGGGTIPEWAGPAKDCDDQLLDLPEVTVRMRWAPSTN